MPGPDGIEVARRLTADGFGGKTVIAARGHDAITDPAGRLHLSQGTVRSHLSAAVQKLGARNRAEAIQIAERRGWL